MGKYVNNNLANGESVIFEVRCHWIIFISLKSLLTLFIAPIIKLKTSEFAITNKRIIIKVGLIRRKTIELNLSKVESVNVDQSILGRILGYGTITVVGTGGTKEKFSEISKPLEFRKAFQQLDS
ncbi:MAG: MFS transporter permease [Spirochaetae bacterium HGW-Spirochaetae-1]|jgi:uncharacterized membrane protein YdbT with pleckstrin-like domain|nr:MAG: MFS transporter permease [Spirochaetae bacterium HGW-Spirochaetae-1]